MCDFNHSLFLCANMAVSARPALGKYRCALALFEVEEGAAAQPVEVVVAVLLPSRCLRAGVHAAVASLDLFVGSVICSFCGSIGAFVSGVACAPCFSSAFFAAAFASAALFAESLAPSRCLVSILFRSLERPLTASDVSAGAAPSPCTTA